MSYCEHVPAATGEMSVQLENTAGATLHDSTRLQMSSVGWNVECVTGWIAPIASADSCSTRYVRTAAVEEEVLRIVEMDPTTSCRAISRHVGLNHTTVLHILHDDELYLYHYTRAQALHQQDYARRVAYCDWLQQQCAQDDTFLERVLWTDEAWFTQLQQQSLVVNHERAHQVRVSQGILAGLCLLPDCLKAAVYHTFVQDVLPQLLEDVPLSTRRDMWLQHNGAPPTPDGESRSCQICAILDDGLDVVARQSGLLDLNPLDFYLWRYLREVVYRQPPNSPELVESLQAACSIVDGGTLPRVPACVSRLATACCAMHFEHLLQDSPGHERRSL